MGPCHRKVKAARTGGKLVYDQRDRAAKLQLKAFGPSGHRDQTLPDAGSGLDTIDHSIGQNHTVGAAAPHKLHVNPLRCLTRQIDFQRFVVSRSNDLEPLSELGVLLEDELGPLMDLQQIPLARIRDRHAVMVTHTVRRASNQNGLFDRGGSGRRNPSGQAIQNASVFEPLAGKSSSR